MRSFKHTVMKRQIAGTVLHLLVCHLFVFFGLPVFAESQAHTPSVQAEHNTLQTARQVVMLIEQDQWEAADSLLAQRSNSSANETLRTLQHILDERQDLEKTRSDRQQQIFTERYERLTAAFERVAKNDPNLNYQNVFRQVQNVWKDATEAQQHDITAQQPFRSLMEHARQNAEDCYANGQWSRAYTTGVWWLMVFEPENPACREWNGKLSEVNAILEFLETSPCEDKKQRYEPIKRRTVRQVFSILQAHYVKPLDYDKMADGMVNRCIILGDVLKTAPDDLVLSVDPNAITPWADHLKQFDSGGQQPDGMNRQGLEDLLDALLALNEKTLKLPEGFLLSMLTDAALAQLDSYTNMVWPYAVEDFDKEMTGQFGGVGIHIRKERGGLRVMSLIPDTPAMRAGLEADALIVAVDGQSTRDMSATCAVRKISGPVGTSVTLTIQYPGSETEELLTIVRDNIVIPAVEGSRQAAVGKANWPADPAPNTMSNKKTNPPYVRQPEGHWDYFLDETNRIGYLKLKSFTEQTVPEVREALYEMESRRLTGLILDLRGNGGGLLSAAVQISDLFINEGILLHSKGRGSTFAIWPATSGDGTRSYPLVVLIDGASASASEIVAGILSSPANHRAVLVGQRSYGKGSMQEVVDMGDDKGKLKYTSAYYYLPDGSAVKNRDLLLADGRDDWGIVPDVSVPLYDFERRRIRQINTKRTRISNTGAERENQAENFIREEMLSADPQLATAVLVLRAEIAVRRLDRRSSGTKAFRYPDKAQRISRPMAVTSSVSPGLKR
jgi:carboxyl-terminal processing protease